MGNSNEVVGKYLSEEEYKKIVWECNMMRRYKLLQIDRSFNRVNDIWYSRLNYGGGRFDYRSFVYRLILAKLLCNWYSNSIVD